MSEAAKFRQRARTYEQRESWKRAIEEYELALQADKRAKREVDLALYNRIGDLYRRTGDVNRAVHYYELAADGHLAAGFYNNGIALCNKILRNQPNRHSAYLKLGKIGAAKGFLSDARKHFLEYAERMQRAGQLDAAFSALVEFAALSPDPEVRLMIADQLIEHNRTGQAVEQLRLAWRDLGNDGREADAREVRDRIMEIAPNRDPEVDPPEAATASELDAEGVLELPEILPWDEPEAEPVVTESLKVEPTALQDDLGALDLEPDDIGLDIESLEPLPIKIEPADTSLDIVPTSLVEEELESAEIEAPAAKDQELVFVPTSLAPEEVVEEPPSLEVIDDLTLQFEDADALEDLATIEGVEILEGLETTEAAEPAFDDFDVGELDLGPAVEEPEVSPADRVAELETRLEVEGRQPQLLVQLADTLLETGKQEPATELLGEALDLFDQEGRYEEAVRVINELLRLDVNDVRAYQKRVELALKAGDRAGLVDAYLGLADCLDRTDAGNKARAVYARVLELDPQNRLAKAALEMLAAEVAVPPPPVQPVSAAPAAKSPADYVDLGELVLEEEKAKSTRFRVPTADPRSEADVNFADMLNQFKSKVAEALEEEDAASHYDLGLAYTDMGLIDEAIAEFQVAARGLEYRLRAIEMLGDCFLEKGDSRIAIKVLGRAVQVPQYKDEDLVGIFYAMGRAYEEVGDAESALERYERVLGCDVNFKDVARRVSTLRQ